METFSQKAFFRRYQLYVVGRSGMDLQCNVLYCDAMYCRPGPTRQVPAVREHQPGLVEGPVDQDRHHRAAELRSRAAALAAARGEHDERRAHDLRLRLLLQGAV